MLGQKGLVGILYLIWSNNDICCDKKSVCFGGGNDIISDIPDSPIQMSPLTGHGLEVLIREVGIGNALQFGRDGKLNVVELLISSFIDNNVPNDVSQDQNLNKSRNNAHL